MGRLRLNWLKHLIIMRSSHLVNIVTSISLSMHHNNHMCNTITTSRITHRINTHHNNHTLREGVVETSKAEEVEQDLVEEEVRLHAIIMEN